VNDDERDPLFPPGGDISEGGHPPTPINFIFGSLHSISMAIVTRDATAVVAEAPKSVRIALPKISQGIISVMLMGTDAPYPVSDGCHSSEGARGGFNEMFYEKPNVPRRASESL